MERVGTWIPTDDLQSNYGRGPVRLGQDYRDSEGHPRVPRQLFLRVSRWRGNVVRRGLEPWNQCSRGRVRFHLYVLSVVTCAALIGPQERPRKRQGVDVHECESFAND